MRVAFTRRLWVDTDGIHCQFDVIADEHESPHEGTHLCSTNVTIANGTTAKDVAKAVWQEAQRCKNRALKEIAAHNEVAAWIRLAEEQQGA